MNFRHIAKLCFPQAEENDMPIFQQDGATRPPSAHNYSECSVSWSLDMKRRNLNPTFFI